MSSDRYLDEEIHRAESLLKSVGIPSPPQLVLELSQEVARDEPDYRTIAALVNQDAALAARVIKLIHSPIYGLGKKVKSITHALTMLGLDLFKRVVLVTALRESILSGLDPHKFEQLWLRNLYVARVAQELTIWLKKPVSPELAYMTGLFHNAGVPLMMKKFPDYDLPLAQSQESGENILDREYARYQTNHCAVGCLLAQTWKLPDEICLAIRHHHRATFPSDLDPSGQGQWLWLILQCADFIAEDLLRLRAAESSGAEWYPTNYGRFFTAPLLNELGVDRESLDPFIADLRDSCLTWEGEHT